jgi:SEC-C motif-containing protein
MARLCAESAALERCTLFGMTAKTTVRPGRNEPCHCGSGRKYKLCCLDKDNAALTAANARAAADAAARTEAAPRAAKRTTGHQTEQPWKASTSRVFVPRPRGPRKVGGS